MASDANRNLRLELARIVEGEHVLTGEDAEQYTHDATIQRGLKGTPDAVIRPADAAQLASALRWCYEHDVAFIARGGGTGLAGGAVPLHGGVVCSLERLNRILNLEPELWRLHTQAGVNTAHIHRLARENGLLFAPDPGAAEQSQIGGNIATNAAGPHAFKYGPTGSWVTGVDVVLAPGELASFGGPLPKDVSGYDMRGLMVGSEGTLGIITAARLRLLPAPEATVPLTIFMEDTESGQRAILDVIGNGMRPAVLDFLDEPALAATSGSLPVTPPAGAGFLLLVEVDGTRQEVDLQLRELEQLMADCGALGCERPDPASLWRWRNGLNGAIAGLRGGKISEDVGVPVERLAEAVSAIHRIGADRGLPACAWGHAGDGIVHATFMVDLADERELTLASAAADQVFALAIELGGSVTAEHGVGAVKRGHLQAQWGAVALAAHQRIKRALDPKGLLNPSKKDR
jgi:glycolate oxidase subunit GlcD